VQFIEFISKIKEIVQYKFKSKFHDLGIPMLLIWFIREYRLW